MDSIYDKMVGMMGYIHGTCEIREMVRYIPKGGDFTKLINHDLGETTFHQIIISIVSLRQTTYTHIA